MAHQTALEAASAANWTAGILGTLKELLVWMGPPKNGLPPITIQELEIGLRPWSSRLDALRNSISTAPGDPSLQRLTALQNRLEVLLPPIQIEFHPIQSHRSSLTIID